MANLAVKAGLVKGADLRKQDGGVLFQSGDAAGNMDVDRIVFREALRGEWCYNDCGCGFVADVVLDDHDRPSTCLL